MLYLNVREILFRGKGPFRHLWQSLLHVPIELFASIISTSPLRCLLRTQAIENSANSRRNLECTRTLEGTVSRATVSRTVHSNLSLLIPRPTQLHAALHTTIASQRQRFLKVIPQCGALAQNLLAILHGTGQLCERATSKPAIKASPLIEQIKTSRVGDCSAPPISPASRRPASKKPKRLSVLRGARRVVNQQGNSPRRRKYS